ncbi:uncharacterized protein LOC135815813 [Sycon ciliatum]|uniref:uncharacterized protein LOC135815813 n=1 Tax=Sycon ciliatum TaxID=27933 RepID=UPI0031F6C247
MVEHTATASTVQSCAAHSGEVVEHTATASTVQSCAAHSGEVVEHTATASTVQSCAAHSGEVVEHTATASTVQSCAAHSGEVVEHTATASTLQSCAAHSGEVVEHTATASTVQSCAAHSGEVVEHTATASTVQSCAAHSGEVVDHTATASTVQSCAAHLTGHQTLAAIDAADGIAHSSAGPEHNVSEHHGPVSEPRVSEHHCPLSEQCTSEAELDSRLTDHVPSSPSILDEAWHVQRDRLFSLVKASEEAHRHLSQEVEEAQMTLSGGNTHTSERQESSSDAVLVGCDTDCGRSTNGKSLCLHSDESLDESITDESSQLLDYIRNARMKHAEEVSSWVLNLKGSTPSSDQLQQLVRLQLHQQDELRDVLESGDGCEAALDPDRLLHNDVTLSEVEQSIQDQSNQLSQLLSQLQSTPTRLPLEQQLQQHHDQRIMTQHLQGNPQFRSSRSLSDVSPFTNGSGVCDSTSRFTIHQSGSSATKSVDSSEDDIANTIETFSMEKYLAILPTCVTIPSAKLQETGKGSPYHVFQVQVSIGSFYWSVERRYREFLAQHLHLVQEHGELSCLRMPPTKWFGNKKRGFVEERRKRLETYLQTLLFQLIRLQHCNWHTLVSLEDLVNKMRNDLPVLDEHTVIPAARVPKNTASEHTGKQAGKQTE